METNTNIYKIYIGLNDQESKKQEIDTNDALVIVSEYLANHFEGATAYNAIGIYKHENGEVVRENSIVIELVFVNDESRNSLQLRFYRIARLKSGDKNLTFLFNQ